MSKPRVLLISAQYLFSESIEMILRAEKEIEFIGPWNLNESDICERIQDINPSVVVIASIDIQNESATALTKAIIEKYPETTIIRTALNENTFRIFSTQTVPARGDSLLETIRDSINPNTQAKQSGHS